MEIVSPQQSPIFPNQGEYIQLSNQNRVEYASYKMKPDLEQKIEDLELKMKQSMIWNKSEKGK